ncbi:MAG: hypothetical protein EB120_09420 [Proteobacteria bacterium]|nr:hypothetical protein [Pseudomonadota bacterium]
MRHTSSPLLSHFFCLSYFLISPNSLVWAERSSPHSFDAMESFSRRNQRPEAYEVVYPEPTFEVVEPAKEFKWKDNIPYHKDVPILRNVYEHRAPQEAGILFVNGKQASMMSEDTGTIAHELTHGINSHLEKDNPDFAGFYVPGKGSVLVQKPLARRVHIAPFIPKELRGIDGDGGRFNTYIQDKHGREPDAGSPFVDGTKQVGAANALYPWDEWNSYINGAKAALQAEQKFGKQNSDYLTGPVEFSIYALGSMTYQIVTNCYHERYWLFLSSRALTRLKISGGKYGFKNYIAFDCSFVCRLREQSVTQLFSLSSHRSSSVE